MVHSLAAFEGAVAVLSQGQFPTALGASLGYCNKRFIAHPFNRSPLSLKNKVPLFKWNFGITTLKPCLEEVEDVDNRDKKMKSETYSVDMTQAMGTVLTYRHELGMNYNFVLPDLIVGSCLQTPADVDKLKSLGVATIFCLQQDADLEYFSIDICAIQDRANMLDGIEHIRAPIRDFDPFDLRARLPMVIADLHKAIGRNSGITYVHCTAGLGRAPAVALTYMFWILGYNLDKANTILQAVRPCFPKLDSIRNATYDILTGGGKEHVLLQWKRGTCQKVEIAGLDVGWDQQIPLIYNAEERSWNLRRELPVGRFEYKYIVDGMWVCNPDEPVTEPNIDGHVNNYVEVTGDLTDHESIKLRKHLTSEGAQLSTKERNVIMEKLKALSDC